MSLFLFCFHQCYRARSPSNAILWEYTQQSYSCQVSSASGRSAADYHIDCTTPCPGRFLNRSPFTTSLTKLRPRNDRQDVRVRGRFKVIIRGQVIVDNVRSGVPASANHGKHETRSARLWPCANPWTGWASSPTAHSADLRGSRSCAGLRPSLRSRVVRPLPPIVLRFRAHVIVFPGRAYWRR